MTYTETIAKIDNDLKIRKNSIKEKYLMSINLWSEIFHFKFGYATKADDGFEMQQKIFRAKNESEEKAEEEAEEARKKAKKEAIDNLESLIETF